MQRDAGQEAALVGHQLVELVALGDVAVPDIVQQAFPHTEATVTGWAGERAVEVTAPDGRHRITGDAVVLATGAHPIQLRDQVASPRGTTIRGIAELEEQLALEDQRLAELERQQTGEVAALDKARGERSTVPSIPGYADLEVIGLLRVMFDPRITLQQQVSDQLKAHFGDKVFNTVIPRNVRLAEAPSYGLPGVVFDPSAKGSQAYVDFAQELVVRAPTL